MHARGCRHPRWYPARLSGLEPSFSSLDFELFLKPGERMMLSLALLQTLARNE